MPWYTDGHLVGLPLLAVCYFVYGLLLLFHPRWSSLPLHGFLEFIHPKLAAMLTSQVVRVLGAAFLLMSATTIGELLTYLSKRTNL